MQQHQQRDTSQAFNAAPAQNTVSSAALNQLPLPAQEAKASDLVEPSAEATQQGSPPSPPQEGAVASLPDAEPSSADAQQESVPEETQPDTNAEPEPESAAQEEAPAEEAEPAGAVETGH